MIEPRERQHVREGRPVAEPGEMRLQRHAGAAHRVAALAADGHDGEVALVLGDLAGREPDRVGVERSGEPAVRGDEHDQALAALAGREQRVVLAVEDGRQVREDLVELVRVRPRRQRRVLRALELGRGHELERPRDLLDVADGGDPLADLRLGQIDAWARRGKATPSMRASALERCVSEHVQRVNAAIGRPSVGHSFRQGTTGGRRRPLRRGPCAGRRSWSWCRRARSGWPGARSRGSGRTGSRSP